MSQLLNLTEDDYWSTLTQSYPCDDNVKRTIIILIDKYNITTPSTNFENFVEKSTLMYGIKPLYSYSAPGYTKKLD